MKKKTSSPLSKKKILLVDDHPMMREGLAQLIRQEADLAVCGEAENVPQALDAVTRLKPDLVLVDITLPGRNGIELIKDIQAIQPGLAALVISMHDENLYAERVLRAGGRGYIMKQEGGEKMMQAIRQVLNGKVYVSEKMAARILDVFSGQAVKKEGALISGLTDREFELFQLIGQGKGTPEIAEDLHLSAKTVEVHRANIKKKLKLKTTPQLICYAVRWVDAEKAG